MSEAPKVILCAMGKWTEAAEPHRLSKFVIGHATTIVADQDA